MAAGLPGVRLQVIDGNLNLVESTGEIPVVRGVALGGIVGAIYRYSQAKACADELLGGPAVTAACHILDVAGGEVDVVVTGGSTVGTLSSVTQVGSGPAVTAAISPVDFLAAYQIDDPAGTPVYVNDTADLASATVADVNPWPATEAIGDQFAFGFNAPFNSLRITISTAGTVGTLKWKFWNGTAWTEVSGLTDGTTGFTAVPGTYTVTFTMPTTWQTKEINGSGPLYFLVAEVLTTYTIDPVLSQGQINNIGPNDLYTGKVEVMGGGALGVGTCRYTLDGVTWSATRIIPAGGTFAVPDAGITLTFAAGTYVVGTTYSFTAVPRMYTSGDLDVAVASMLAVNDRWKLMLDAGMAASASSAATLASAAAGHLDDMADDFRLMRGFFSTGNDTPANVNTQFLAVEDLRVSLYASQERVEVANPIEGWKQPWLPTSFNAAAMAAKFTRGTNIGWVGDGAPPNGGRKPRVTAILFDESPSKDGGENGVFFPNKINATRTHIGRTGFYWNGGLLKSPAGSDFRYTHWGMAFDVACETAVDAILPYTNASLNVVPDGSGHMDPVVAAGINKEVNAELRTATMELQIEGRGGTGLFTEVEYKVDETYDILRNEKFRGDLRCVPKANTEQSEIRAGLSASVGANAPEAA